MKALLIILPFLAAQAYATEPEPTHEPTPQTETVVQTTVEVSPTQTITSESISGPATATTGGVITTISNKRPYKNTPNAYAAPIYPTVPCFKGASASASATGFGISLGAGKIDEACERRELIRLAPESHKLYLFCNEPTVLAMFEDFQTCLDYVPRETNEEVMLDGGREDSRGTAPRYDDTALTQQIEALVARVGAVENDSKQTKVRARERARTTPPDPYKAMQAKLRQDEQQGLIVRVEK